MKDISKAVAGSHYSEAVSNPVRSAGILTLARLTAWMAVPCLIMLLSACGASKHIQAIPVETIKERTKSDTLYINNVQYDSIYISQNRYTDRSKDTILIRQHDVEYRYKLLRDTIERIKLEVRHDSIPYEVRITETIEVPRRLTWYDHLTRAAFWLLTGFLLLWLYKRFHKP